MVLTRRFLSCSTLSRFDVRLTREFFFFKFQSASLGEDALPKCHFRSVPNRACIRDGIVRSPYPGIALPDVTLDELLLTKVDNWPERIALECSVSGQTYTFEQLWKLSLRFAASLRNGGYQPGDVISVLLPNVPEYAVVLLGALRAGLIVAPNNPIYTPYEMAHFLEDSGATAVVTTVDIDPKLNEVRREIESKTKRPYSLKKIFMKLGPNDELPSGALSYEDMISDRVTAREVPTCRRSEDVAVLCYSSGTTGLPKGVQLTHKNLVSNIMQTVDDKVGCIRSTTKDYQERLVAYLPLFHMYGLGMVLMRSIFHGCRTIVMPKFETQQFVNVLKNYRPTILHTVPPTVLWLGNSKMVTADDLGSVTHIMCGGAPQKAEDNEGILTKLKADVRLCQVYGATEVAPLALLSCLETNDFSGLLPICNTEVKLVKSDGSLARPNEEGEICIKGPQVMKGYLNNLDKTNETIDEDEFYHTGDVGSYNEEGIFKICDRIKELIKVKGFQVSPSELEALLRSHPCITDAAVIGIPDARAGEKPIAFVVKDASAAVKVDEETLKAFIAQKVSPYKRLAAVYFIDAVPKNLSGKILRRVLKDEYLKKHS